MSSCKILYVCQEITPYLAENDMSTLCRTLSQSMQERGNEIRTFMPRYGLINERRNQLHEVIRLSGMNLIIDDNDHQLIIKVASIPSARVQIYFIDNEDYFQRKFTLCDGEGSLFADNDERAIFFARGVLETVKKLRWVMSCMCTVGSRRLFRSICAIPLPTTPFSKTSRSSCRSMMMGSMGSSMRNLGKRSPAKGSKKNTPLFWSIPHTKI